MYAFLWHSPIFLKKMHGLHKLHHAAIGIGVLWPWLQADDTENGAAPAEAPSLWAVEQVAQPLADKLRLQFGPGQPLDHPDRPELLCSLVVKLTKATAPSLAPLQAAIAAPLADLPQHWYFVPVEFARAMRGVVQVG